MSTPQILPVSLTDVVEVLRPCSWPDVAALVVACIVYAGFALRKHTWDKSDPLDYIFYERPQEKDGGQTANRKTRNIAYRLEELNKNLVIFWGSQSGTAEGFAERLGRELHQRFHLEALVADLSDFDPESLTELSSSKTAVFILATYGEGDPSDNASPFWDWLAKLQDTTLASLRYAALGLGNSHYRYYNRVADVVDDTLRKHGATSILPLSLADDAKEATEETFTSWKDDILKRLQQTYSLEEHEVKFDPNLSVMEDDSLDIIDLHLSVPVYASEGSRMRKSANSPIRPLHVRTARELFASPGRSCIHMELDLGPHSQISYKTGDHLAVWPVNPDDEVQRLLRLLDAADTRNIPLHVKALDPSVKIKVPTPTTLDALLRHYLEICAPVPRDVVVGLAEFAPSTSTKDFLLRLGRDKDAYAAFVAANYINLGRLLELANQGESIQTWPKVPIPFLIEFLPRAQPRYYSISSSSIVAPRSPSITVGIADKVLPANAEMSIPGLATNYLLAAASSVDGFVSSHGQDGENASPMSKSSQYNLDGTVFAHIRRSKFKLPALPSCPLLMVAAGTGLAPFRGFIEERIRLQSVGKPIGKMILFFGCQHPERDFIYQSELREFQAQLGDKLQVIAAFSRLNGKPRYYVQDRVREMADGVCGMLDDGASFYVCGRASMAREVGKVVRDATMAKQGWNESQIKAWGEDMKRNRKWQEDVWG